MTAGHVSYSELYDTMSIDDIDDLNIVIAAEAAAARRARAKAERKREG